MVTEPPALTPAAIAMARALRLEAAAASMADALGAVGIPMMVLKDPPIQERLLGTPTAYSSDDVDVLVPRSSAAATRRRLERSGFTFAPVNGRLWRLDRAAAYTGHSVHVDVHWGLHVDLISARRLRPIEDELWRTARPGDRGRLEPDVVPLAAYLLLHSASRLAHPGKRALAIAATDAARPRWSTVEALVADCGMEEVLRRTVAAIEGVGAEPLDALAITYGPLAARLIRTARLDLPGRLSRRQRPRRRPRPAPQRG